MTGYHYGFNVKKRIGSAYPNSKDWCLAGDEGFEPPITGPEPVALPLGQSPSH